MFLMPAPLAKKACNFNWTCLAKQLQNTETVTGE